MAGTQDARRKYLDHRPLLLSALAWLGKQGFRTTPTEGLELLHDFYIDAWPQLESRYDPRLGSFTTYLFGAFVRFARRRILESERLRRTTVGLDDIVEDIEVRSPDTGAEGVESLDQERVRRALEQLSETEMHILQACIVEPSSERAVARRLGLSRHSLREQAGAALGRLAAILDEPGMIEADDWRLTRALWRDGLALEDAAAQLGMTSHQAKQTRKRVLGALGSALLGLRVDRRKD